MASDDLIILSPLRAAKGPSRKGIITPQAGDSLSEKLAYLAQALQEIACHKCPKSKAKTLAILRQKLTLHSDSLRTLQIDMTHREEITLEKLRLLETTVDELRATIQSGEEECKKVAQDLRHAQNERLKANERARDAEERPKKALQQRELDLKETSEEKRKAQQLQKRIDGLLQEVQLAAQQYEHDHAKSKNPKVAAAEVIGLQRGLDKAKAQLKKKQEEFQSQALTLQQMTVKVKNLEQRFDVDQMQIQRLEERLRMLTSQMEEERLQFRSERLSTNVDCQKGAGLLSSMKKKYQAATAEIARLSRLLDFEVEKAAKREVQMNEVETDLRQLLHSEEERCLRLDEQLHSYEPLGDSNIADRIRIRNLVDQVQERLATKAGLKPSGPGELLSLTWRVALGPSVDDSSRVQRAKELLAGKDLDQHDRAFLADEEALRHVCQHYSRFRKPGNHLHQMLTRDGYLTSVHRYLKYNPSEDKGDALFAMVDYVCLPSN
ncbi:hypothetical protein CPB84DRAFT_1779936 [Gymnopilus junonius]|uniref:Uncharacterized protein n=1 Tax=Gymnopilus junonius TaxID=109634 RepID=A0A9P5TNE8_GYMJU|nr:hypothetical protein CPB84DRAFT_1779936 [Gymnopilus junonius]